MTTEKLTEKPTHSTNQQPVWAVVKVSQCGTTIIRHCKTCGELHTLKDPHAE